MNAPALDQAMTAAVHSMPATEAVRILRSDAERGLSGDEARSRLAHHGPNELRKAPRIPAWRRFLGQFRDSLVILLLVAAAVSGVIWLIERDAPLPYESMVIFAIVFLNAILGFVQEEHAESALSAIRKMSAPAATVIRDSEHHRIEARDVVPGDLLLIEEGDTIPADARLIDVVELRTVEASLTGESVAVEKHVEPVPEESSLGDRKNLVFAGTAVAYGHARAVVSATGMHTELGRIARLLENTEADRTPLQRELDRTGKRLGIGVIAIAAVVVTTLLLVEDARDLRAMLNALLFGVALAVAAVPEGLAPIVTVALAIGVQHMARRGAIVRKLTAVETLGSATVIASDKTGTLTRNQMTVRTIVTRSGRVDIPEVGRSAEGEFPGAGEGEGEGYREAHQEEVEHVLRGSVLANNARLTQDGESQLIHGDPTEVALISAAELAGLSKGHLEQRFRRVREVPFSSERKMMSSLNVGPDGQITLWAKGAPDVILERSAEEFSEGEATTLMEGRRAELTETNRSLAKDALRTLAVAYRALPQELDYHRMDSAILESNLVFVGLIGMIDPPRPEAADAVKRAKKAGIRPIMITGDHPTTALAIARELGIGSGERAVTGAELDRLSAGEFASVVGSTSVYARVNPSHKMRIVDALQATGAIVAMTGDGVNDAPALKSADIGVAMGITGTDVSKEAADVVLTDDNFATIVAAVEEGRAIFANIRKFLLYLLSSNVGEVLTIFLGVVFASPLGLSDQGGLFLPLLATQILWINLITDGPPALALGVDPPSTTLMTTPPRPPQEPVITRSMWTTVGLVGMIMATGTLLVLDASMPGGLLEGDGDVRHGRTMAFTTLVLFQLFNAFNARSERESAFTDFLRNPWLFGAIGISFALQVFVVHLPPFQDAFETKPLSLSDWLTCFVVASMVVWIMEAVKFTSRRAE